MDTGTDAAPPPVEDLCAPIAQGSQLIGTSAVPGLPPAPTGGQLRGGNYFLAELRYYDEAGSPVPPSVEYARSTLRVSANGLRILDSRGTDPDALPVTPQKSWTFRVNGTSLELTGTCTTGGAQTLAFSVDANFLFIHTGAKTIEVYGHADP